MLVADDVRAGREDDVRPVIVALEAETTVTASAALARHLSYARAVLAGDDHAEGEFQAALRADLIRWPWLRARLELAYGSWLRRCGDLVPAGRPVRAGTADRPARLSIQHSQVTQAPARARRPA